MKALLYYIVTRHINTILFLLFTEGEDEEEEGEWDEEDEDEDDDIFEDGDLDEEEETEGDDPPSTVPEQHAGVENKVTPADMSEDTSGDQEAIDIKAVESEEVADQIKTANENGWHQMVRRKLRNR